MLDKQICEVIWAIENDIEEMLPEGTPTGASWEIASDTKYWRCMDFQLKDGREAWFAISNDGELHLHNKDKRIPSEYYQPIIDIIDKHIK